MFTSDVKNKEPTDKLERAEPGHRVWLHLALRNRTGEARTITVTFSVNNEQRSKIELKVEPSWSYRTWAYSTLRTNDTNGELIAEVHDETGATLGTGRLAIKAPHPN